MGSVVEATGRAFERLLRWLYPGLIFFVLLFLFREPTFNKLLSLQHFEWVIIIGGLGISAAIYLIEVYVFEQIINIIAQKIDWLVLEGDRRSPKFFPKRIVDFIDRQAKDIEYKYISRQDRQSYMSYANAAYHALCITGWQILFFYLFREQGSLLSEIELWIIIVILLIIFVFSLSYYARLSRVIE